MSLIAPAAGRPGAVHQIQYLRAIAAVLVVLHHALAPERCLSNPITGWVPGARGVDIFFVVSGFIMFLTSARLEATEFWRRRLVRIVPLYWIVSIAYVLLIGMNPPILDLAKSLAFVPFYNEIYGGRIWPVFAPGWTLNYEMFFYLLVALGLLLKRPVLASTALIAGLTLLGALAQPDSTVARTYTSPIMLEFSAGLGLGALFARTSMKGLVWMLPLGAALLLGVLAHEEHNLVSGVAAVLIVAGALSLEPTWSIKRIDWLHYLGDASYAIYLLHPVALRLLRRFIAPLGLEGVAEFALFTLACVVLSIVAGIIAHELIEKPITRALVRPPRPRAAAPANSAAA